MKCTCKGLLGLAGGIAMISSAAVASPVVDRNAPVTKVDGKMAANDTVDSRITQQFEAGSNRGDVTCPPGAIDENEPLIPDLGTDVTNGGCFMDTPAFSSISVGDTVCGQINTYENADGTFSTDTDWWQFTITETTELEFTLDFSGHGGSTFGVLGNDCNNLAFLPGAGWNVPLASAPFSFSITVEPGTYNIFMRTLNGQGLVPGGYPYNITLAVAGQTPGACCLSDGSCVDTIEADCDGLFTPEVTCAEVTCSTVECPTGGIVEGFTGGENLFDGYDDALNSGCNAAGGKAFDGFAPLNCGDTVCGTSGVHTNSAGGTVRDQDWFRFDTAVDINVAIDYSPSYDGTIVLLRLNSDGTCPADLGSNIVEVADVLAGQTGTLNATIAPGAYTIFAQASTFDNFFLNLPYTWTITTCDTNVAPVGCCFSDGSCQDLLPGACETAGGNVQQVVCAEVTCPVIAANDVFEGALPVDCGTTFVADLNTASPGGVEFPFSCGLGGNTATNSLWYSFVAADTVATVTSCGVGNAAPADDTLIDVFSFDGTNLTEVGCGDDSCTAAGGGAFLTTVNLEGLTVGETYYIRVAAWSAGDVAAYNIELSCAAIPVAENDVFEGAITVACGDSFTADLATATPGFDSDGFPFACRIGGVGGTNTLWYAFEATDTEATITTCASDPALDSIIDVYSFDGTTLTELGCNDDDEVGSCIGTFLSTLQVSGLTVGETYYIRIGAWGTGTVAEYNVEIICGEIVFAENDTFDGAIPVECNSTFFADIREASPGTDGDGFPFACRIDGPGGTHTLWYSFVATGDSATITTCASTAPAAQDSIIDAYSFDGTNLTEIGCNDDDETCDFFLSTLELTGLNVGETYYIRIGAWGTGSLDEYQVDITCGSGCNPACADSTGDGNVDLDDLNAILTQFGQNVAVGAAGDSNCDGVVDLDDLNAVLTQFGQSCN